MTAYTHPLREALNASISSGRFADTKIILHSRKYSSGTVYGPRALYASSHVLKTVSYFSDLLSGTFAEGEPKDLSQPIDESECAENYGYHSDSDLEDDDVDVKAGGTLNKTATLRGHPFDPFCFPISDETSTYGQHNELAGKGKVVKVRDIAFVTFQAFLLYLYTGSIKFAPYGSEENRKSRSDEIVSLSEDSIPRPSPKSIYRLADKYDIPPLKVLALDCIRDGLQQCDIVEEVFSEFSSNYEDVRIMQVNHLVSVLSSTNEESATKLCEKIDERIDSYASGDLDHAVGAITLLWKLSKGDGPSPASPVATSSKRCASSPADRRAFEMALIKSIREGIFFDRKYWTRYSKTAKALRPLYISSTVADKKLSYINGMVKPLREDECLDSDSGSEDSDCESHLEHGYASTPGDQVDEKKESDRESLPVLATGSFASWRSLFFYLCTGTIEFAPLKSQGADVRAQYVKEETQPDKPPPCSPKAIYSLASALDIKPLRDLAIKDIQSKIISSTVVDELFSSFTSRQDEIMKMECEILYDKFNNDTTTAEGVELIESMQNGRSAHRVGALKAGLRRGLMGSVFLRCPKSRCSMYNNTTPYRSLGSSLRCMQNHSSAPYLECAGCGTSRTDADSISCRDCKKRFR